MIGDFEGAYLTEIARKLRRQETERVDFPLDKLIFCLLKKCQ